MMTHDTTAMILAAGLGTRLKALTQDKPKALVPLNGKPLLQHCIENLLDNGFHHIVINVHHFGEQIIDFVESHTGLEDCKIEMLITCQCLRQHKKMRKKAFN